MLSKKTTLYRLLRLIYLPSFLPSVLASLFSSLASVLLMASAAYIIASAALHPPLYTLALSITLVRACGIGRAVFRYLDRWLSHRATFALLTRLRTGLYSLAVHLLPLRAPGVTQGALLHEMTYGMEVLKDFYLRVLAPPLLALLLVLLAFSFLFPLQPIAALLVFFAWAASLGIPFTAVLCCPESSLQKADTQYRNLLLDIQAGLSELQCSGSVCAQQQLDKAMEQLQLLQCRQEHQQQISDFCSRFVRDLFFVLIFALLLQCTIHGQITGIELAVLLLALQTVFAELQPLPEAVRALHRTFAAARDLPADALQPAMPLYGQKTTPKNDLETTPDLLAAYQLSFSYEGQVPILQKLDFSLQSGEKLAILGDSGSGKTTLFHLLLRLWEPEQGSLSLNGKNYAEYSAAEIRRHFAAATQSCYIFNETIRECFQRLYPDITDDTIWQALEIAQLAPALQESSSGLERNTGPDGALLSCGQRQRLLLALAFASPAPILLLDEPTAGLDAANASALASSILHHFSQRTMLIITHDQQLAAKMDRCLYLSLS